MGIKLYTYWRSSSAYRVRIALNLKGLEYEPVLISLAPGVHENRQDEYRAINPQMLVPFFDDGKDAIGQSCRCCQQQNQCAARYARSATSSAVKFSP